MAAKRKRPARMAESDSIVHLKVTLLESDPPIWRRLQVPAGVTLGELHYILQAAMGWTNSHLHQFRFGDVGYSDPRFELDDAEDQFNVTLGDMALREGLRFEYQYDFGDNWLHEVTVEKILPREPGKRYPICIAGERACPPEDCGGVWSYDEFLEAIRDPEHDEHEDMLEWIGGSFDPEAFDVDDVNRRLIQDARTLASWR